MSPSSSAIGPELEESPPELDDELLLELLLDELDELLDEESELLEELLLDELELLLDELLELLDELELLLDDELELDELELLEELLELDELELLLLDELLDDELESESSPSGTPPLVYIMTALKYPRYPGSANCMTPTLPSP